MDLPVIHFALLLIITQTNSTDKEPAYFLTAVEYKRFLDQGGVICLLESGVCQRRPFVRPLDLMLLARDSTWSEVTVHAMGRRVGVSAVIPDQESVGDKQVIRLSPFTRNRLQSEGVFNGLRYCYPCIQEYMKCPHDGRVCPAVRSSLVF